MAADIPNESRSGPVEVVDWIVEIASHDPYP